MSYMKHLYGKINDIKICYNSRAILTLESSQKIARMWWKHIPFIQPYYSVKSFPNKELITMLDYENFKFDCASRNEIKLVNDILYNKPNTKINKDNSIIFSNSVKSIDDIIYAKYNNNMNIYAVDSVEEVEKIKWIDKDAKYMIRILSHEDNSLIKFNAKFGASLNTTINIINYIHSLQLDFYGYSYHVGSKCKNMESHTKTINNLLENHIKYSDLIGLKTQVINIGGGFETADQIIEIGKIYDRFKHIFHKKNISVIAEPGRLISAPSLSIAVKVIAIRKMDNHYNITINDSVYHSFQGKIYDYQSFTPIPQYYNTEIIKCNIFGQTCDSIDVICENITLPLPNINDIILFENMGAYSLASSTGNFNGFSSAEF